MHTHNNKYTEIAIWIKNITKKLASILGKLQFSKYEERSDFLKFWSHNLNE